MKGRWTIGLALLVGFGAGAIAMQGLHAQAKRPAYYVAEIDVTGDAASYERDYVPKVKASIKSFGGKSLVAAQKPVTIEGPAPLPRVAIVAFDSMDAFLAWRNSDQYKEDRKISDKYATVKSYAVEGLAE
jgi:uncharacterized protein (DUF1330 family)